MNRTTGTCPACGSSAQPLVIEIERFGYVAFHEACRAVLLARMIVARIPKP